MWGEWQGASVAQAFSTEKLLGFMEPKNGTTFITVHCLSTGFYYTFSEFFKSVSQCRCEDYLFFQRDQFKIWELK